MCRCFCFQAEDGIRDLVRSRGLGDVYKRQRLEGDLDAAQTQALDKFLYEHPQFEQDAKRIGASLSLIHI